MIHHPIIRVGIVGYGNLGRGVECAIAQNPDMELVGVFSRRPAEQITLLSPQVSVYPMEQLEQMTDAIDVLIICGGSATDLPKMTPTYAEFFHVVDSFDTHAKIPQHFSAVDMSANKGNKVAIISVGWDPGLFSLQRVLAEAVLPTGATYTFWGKGVSQGHSDAVRRVAGVIDARQYTIPSEAALQQVREGKRPQLTTRDKHTRVCYVVTEEGANQSAIEAEILAMPDYFAEYDTTVHFISKEEMKENHNGLPHGGMVLRSGSTGWSKEHEQLIEYRLQLESNPEFTASVLTAYARAAVRLGREGAFGCKTVFDIAPAYLLPQDAKEMRKHLL